MKKITFLLVLLVATSFVSCENETIESQIVEENNNNDNNNEEENTDGELVLDGNQ